MNQIESKNIHDVPISIIIEDGNLPRKFFNKDKLKELSESIKEQGIIQPLIIRPRIDSAFQAVECSYSIILGKRRFAAARLAGLKNVPCVIEDTDDQRALELALVENIQRDDLMPFEEAWGIVRLMKDYGYSIEETAKKLGKGVDFIRTRLKILSLPEDVQKQIAQGELGLEHASYLVNLPSVEQTATAKEIIDNSLSRDQARILVDGKKIKIKGIVAEKAVENVKREVTPQRIGLQINNLQRLLNCLDCKELPRDQIDDLRDDLTEHKWYIEKILEEIDKFFLAENNFLK